MCFISPPSRVEASILFFAVAALGSFLILYALLRLFGHTLALPATVRAFRASRRQERAHAALASALQAYYEGRYARAEKEAALAFDTGPTPGIAALLAARAAHQMRDFQRRDAWLERGAGAWEEVLRLATQLAKRDAIAPALAEEYKLQATVELLARSADDAAAFERRWRAIAARDQQHPRVAAAAARHATALGKAALARDIIEQALAAEWSPQLVRRYGELPAGLDAAGRATEARVRIERAEQWLLERSRDAELLAALGHLCAEAELWGKAHSFLEASLSFEESRTAHLELARLAERLGQAQDAQRHYRRAAEL